jgi:hypothetical protein
MDQLDRIWHARGVTVATAAKRQLALPETLYKELDWLARREGKSVALILRDLLGNV